MADLLIRGLRMPLKNEEPVHLTITEDGRVIVGGSYTIYRAVELPDYGRLIDADALLSKDRHIYRADGATIGINPYISMDEIDEADTIISASKEGGA